VSADGALVPSSDSTIWPTSPNKASSRPHSSSSLLELTATDRIALGSTTVRPTVPSADVGGQHSAAAAI
jgi:hypothetical protein